jgi:hypothetical protein
MRGRILQYNGTDGTGVVVADGQQYKFSITNWKADTPPAVGKTVELTLADGQVHAVTQVPDDVLLREKTAELTGELSGMVGGAAGAGGVGGMLVGKFGKPILIAYGVFLIATLFLPAVNMPMIGGEPMFKLASLLATLGGGGGVKLLLILSYLSIAVPFFWPDKKGWLALLLPLLAVLWAFVSARKATGGPMGGGGGLGDVFGILGVGFYLAIIAAIVLALQGFKKYATA